MAAALFARSASALALALAERAVADRPKMFARSFTSHGLLRPGTGWGRGVGKALFHAVARRAVEMNAQRLEWQVLDWNEPAIGFYKHLDASVEHSWLNGRLTRSQLDSMPLGQPTQVKS